MSLSELLKRAQFGKLTASELSDVVQQVSSGQTADFYTSLHILGRAGSSIYKAVVEPYLHCETDPLISALALKILCRWWGLLDEYKDQLVMFLKGVEWDKEDDIKLQSIGIAGECLRQKPDRTILEIVYKIFADRNGRPILRSAAYSAICRSQGMNWENVPPAWRVTDFSKEVDSALLNRIEKILADMPQ